MRRYISAAAAMLLAVTLVATNVASADNHETEALSAYYGGFVLPNQTSQNLCPGNGGFPPSAGYGGMPFVVSNPLDPQGGFDGNPLAFDPTKFVVEVGADHRQVTPVCATLLPALNPGELRTVLLVGDFGLGGVDVPTKITITGDVRTVGGESLTGLTIDQVSPIEEYPGLLLAELFETEDGVINTSRPGDGTQGAFCPDRRTTRVIKLTFGGGASAEDGGQLRRNQAAIAAVNIVGIDEAGQRTVLQPFDIRDDDNDNHLDLCLGQNSDGLTLERVAIFSHTFYAPFNVPAPAAFVEITAS